MQRINYNIGESRHIRLLIKSANDEAFAIKSANWELIKNGQTEYTGTCLIEDHVIDAFITPSESTTYKLKFVYQIADETLIEVLEVAVK